MSAPQSCGSTQPQQKTPVFNLQFAFPVPDMRIILPTSNQPLSDLSGKSVDWIGNAMCLLGGRDIMKVAIVTGPSGAGKTYVHDSLKECHGATVSLVCTDRLLREAIRIAFPLIDPKSSVSSVLDACKGFSLEIDWTKAVSLASQKLMIDQSDRYAICGALFREPRWRRPLLSGLGISESREQRVFAIMPGPLQLQEQRNGGKRFHRSRAGLRCCKRDLKVTRKLLNLRHEKLCWEEFQHSSDALRAVRAFLTD